MKRWRQTRIRTLLIVTMLFAAFAAGYRNGNENAKPQFANFDELMALIENTVVADDWEALGGPSTMAPYPKDLILTLDGKPVRSCVGNWPETEPDPEIIPIVIAAERGGGIGNLPDTESPGLGNEP